MHDAEEERRKEDTDQTGLSRRAFLKGGGALAGAVVLAGAGFGASACTADGDAAGASSDAPSSSPTYEVYDADILIIGTGFGAMGAAFEAYSKGATVLMVDKGPFQFSGATGMNWDQEVSWPNDPLPDFTKASWNDQFANQKLVKNVFDFMGNTRESWDSRLWWVRMGGTTWNRLPNGQQENLISASSGKNLVQRGFSRHNQDTLKSLNVSIVDQTMITDLFMSDGVCVGALGVHVPTGRYRVFRAKATVTATGAGCQMYGWLRTHPISMNTPDNTGDVDAAAYRHGCSLMDSEFFGLDLISVVPASLGASFNSGIGADGNHMRFVCDKDGNFFMRDFVGYDVSVPIRDTILAGKGGEHGGVFIDLTSDEAIELDKLRPCYARNIQVWKEQFGIDVRSDGYKIPVSLEAFEHSGSPRIDENGMTEVPGLFGTRGYGIVKGHITQQTYVGAYAGKCAVDYASGTGAAAVDWTAAVAEFERLDEIRTREVEGGLRPHQIRHAIQDAFYAAHEPGSDAERLQACITELERIKTQDLPKMIVADKTSVFNVDWKQAIENYNILTLAEASARAGLMREETRQTHYRTDFPEKDDANWKCSIAAKLVDGQMALEKVPQVTL